MSKHTYDDPNVLGGDSGTWGLILLCVSFFDVFGCFFHENLDGHPLKTFLVGGVGALAFCFTLAAWILALVRGRREELRLLKERRWQDEEEQDRKREQEKRERRLRIASSPAPIPAPDPYLHAEAELQVRMDHTQKMQRLHELRKQVEEEERKAGVFAPTLAPVTSSSPDSAASSSAEKVRLPQDPSQELIVSAGPAYGASRPDPLADEMNILARRHQEAERQKHLLQSRLAVEDVEREADGL